MSNLIISTVGTSLITNLADKNQQRDLYKYSNCKENECPSDVKDLIENLFQLALARLNTNDLSSIRRMSAELNGILGFYAENLNGRNNDMHFLICTDTYQGKKSAEVVKNFLNNHNIPAEIIQPRNLSTKNKETFSEGVKDLLRWFDEIIYQYKISGYNIIFNLTGGFKSLQGYLNTVAMFYADKIIYIFESEYSELIEIPRLPIKIDFEPFEKNKEKLLLLNANKIFSLSDFKEIPEAILDEIDGKVILSVWGEVIWNKIKYELFEKLPELPFIKYHDNFKRKIHDMVDKKQKVNLLEALAKVSVILENSNGDTSSLSKSGFQYSPLLSKEFEGKQVYHFRHGIDLRINCIKQNNYLLLIDFGTHDQTQS